MSHRTLTTPCVVILLLASGVVTAEDLPVTTKVLSNGCTLAVVENHQAPVVALRIYVTNTGSLCECERLGSGISHLCKQVVHGGTTESRSEAESARLLQSIGGATDSYTNRDLTCYHGETHVDCFDLMLDLFADWIRNGALVSREIQREREVIKRAKIRERDEPTRVAEQMLVETMFRAHPARHPVMGHLDDFLRITPEDLRKFFRERYVPNNTVVVVGGDVDPVRTLEKLESAFSFWERRTGISRCHQLPTEPRQMGRRVVEAEMDVREAVVRIGFHTIELSHPDLYALDLLAAVLGNGRTSRLHRRVVDRERLTDAVFVASYTPHYGAGVFEVLTRCRYENVPALEAALFEEIDRLAAEPPTEAELTRAKVLIGRDFAMQQRKAADQAEAVAYDLIGTGNPNFSARYVERIGAVTGEQVVAMARKYFSRENETIAVVRSRGEASILVPPTTGATARPGSRGTTRRVVLDNGLTVVLQDNPASPTVGVQAFFRAGVLWETDENAGITNLMARLMQCGTRDRSAEAIAGSLEDAGARMSALSGNNTFGVSMSLPAAGLEAGIGLLADVLRNPSFPEPEVVREKTVSWMLIRRQAGNWETEAARNFREAMFTKHPYRRDRYGTIESVARIDRAKIVAHHAAHCAPQNGVIAVFGDIDLDTAERVARSAFEDWPRGVTVAREVPVEPALTADRTVRYPTEKGQVVIGLGYPGATLDGEDRWVLQVIDAAVSGLGLPSGRLYAALRGERNLVHDVQAVNWCGFGTGAFRVICPCLRDNADEVLEIIRREIARVAEEGLTPEELENAKRMCVTNDQISRQTNEERAAAAALDELYGFGWDASTRDAERIRRITNDDVKRVASRHFAHSVLALTAPASWLERRADTSKR